MKRERIDHVIRRIMTKDGPDRHIDGHDLITDFIVALLDGRGEEWAATYEEKPDTFCDPILSDEELYRQTFPSGL